MRRIVRSRVSSWLLLAPAVGLLGCPLLLDDRFSTVRLSEPDAGEACIGDGCVRPSDNVGGRSGTNGGNGSGSSGAAATAGSTSTAGTTSSAGSGGVSGTAGAGSGPGSGGVSGIAGAGGSTGQGGAEACRTLEVTPTTYDSESNCIGVHGSSTVVVDPASTLELSYDSGDPCFRGTISSSDDGWGAVYELTFAGDDDGETFWNASSTGVTGFEFAYRGSDQPLSLRVIYKDTSGTDNCHVIGGSTAVPFSVAHPGCNASGQTVDSTRLMEMILAFTGSSEPYDVDFCVQIRALD